MDSRQHAEQKLGPALNIIQSRISQPNIVARGVRRWDFFELSQIPVDGPLVGLEDKMTGRRFGEGMNDFVLGGLHKPQLVTSQKIRQAMVHVLPTASANLRGRR